jgi:hypothetical protein
MDNIIENFTNIYNDVRQFLSDKTSMQALKTEQIIQIMQIAATLTMAYSVQHQTDSIIFNKN